MPTKSTLIFSTTAWYGQCAFVTAVSTRRRLVSNVARCRRGMKRASTPHFGCTAAAPFGRFPSVNRSARTGNRPADAKIP